MYFDVVKQKEKVDLGFWRLNDRQKGMTNAFSGKNQIVKLCLVYLHFKQQQSTCACSSTKQGGTVVFTYKKT